LIAIIPNESTCTKTMQQSSALRRLETVLHEAISSGDRNQFCAPILLNAMNLTHEPENFFGIYEILSRAKEEATTLKNQPRLPRYLKQLEDLRQFFMLNHVWAVKWATFVNQIETTGILTTLDALANYFHDQNPTVFLEQDFLEKLSEELGQILNEILKSDVSRELKKLLVEGVEDILSAIRRYHIDGTEGLKKSAQSLVSDLVMAEYTIKDEDKKKPVYRQLQSWIFSLLLYIAPSPYDIIGAVPDIDSFWKPKIEELIASQRRVEQSICETSTLQESIEKAANAFKNQPQKSLAGSKELKALSAAKEDQETNTDTQDNP
jgi:predicted transcriptional regulator